MRHFLIAKETLVWFLMKKKKTSETQRSFSKHPKLRTAALETLGAAMVHTRLQAALVGVLTLPGY